MSPVILTLDFGGTKHSAALYRPGGDGWLDIRRVLSPAGADARADLQQVISLARQISGRRVPAAIGVSFGGPVDHKSGMVRLSHHVEGWENIPLQNILEDEFQAPVRIDNDANAGVLGEFFFGAGVGFSSIGYITVSTGVGSGWLVNGEIWRGSDGMAGEIGHMTIDPQGPECLCGKRGCVESFASGPYLARRARELVAVRPEAGRLLRMLAKGDLKKITSKMVAQAADQGDRISQAAIKRAAWALGVGIGNAANLINPQRFILGGGVTKSGEAFWRSLWEAARKTALPEIGLDIVPAALGDDAPLWGGVALVMNLISDGNLSGL